MSGEGCGCGGGGVRVVGREDGSVGSCGWRGWEYGELWVERVGVRGVTGVEVGV